MDLGIIGFHDLTSGNEKQIHSRFQKAHHSPNRLAAIANKPGTQELSPTSIAQIIQERNPKQSILLIYRKISNSSFTGLLDTHITHRLLKRCPRISQTPKPNKICPSTQHPHHSHAQQHTIGTPLQTTELEAHHLYTQIHQQVMDTPTNPLFLTSNLEPQTSPASSITTTEPQTETQGHVNVPTPSFLEKFTPQCTESNA